MDVELIERNGDIVFVEGFLDAFGQVVIDCPVVLEITVTADVEFQRAVAELFEPYGVLMLFIMYQQFCFAENAEEDFLDLFDVRVIGNRDIDLHSDDGLGGMVVDLAIGDDGVRDDDVRAAVGEDIGVHDVDLLHKPLIFAEFDEVARDKGLGEQDHDTAGNIVEAILER